jgi:hypothetical protein
MATPFRYDPSWQKPDLFPVTSHHKRLAEWTTKRHHHPVVAHDHGITIGVGRDLGNQGLSDDEIDLMLKNDLERARKYLLEHYPWMLRLDPCRFAALQELCMRMGPVSFNAHRQMLIHMELDDYKAAGKRLAKSTWCVKAGADVSAHLIVMLVTGEWPWDVSTLASPEPYLLAGLGEP